MMRVLKDITNSLLGLFSRDDLTSELLLTEVVPPNPSFESLDVVQACPYIAADGCSENILAIAYI